jgi:hypothetical protein
MGSHRQQDAYAVSSVAIGVGHQGFRRAQQMETAMHVCMAVSQGIHLAFDDIRQNIVISIHAHLFGRRQPHLSYWTKRAFRRTSLSLSLQRSLLGLYN